MARVIKEIIIMLLVAFFTMLALAIACYRFMPSKKIVPEVQYYQAPQDIQEMLETISADEGKDEDVIFTYKTEPDQFKVTSSDLKGYQNTNDYVPGKSNPFSQYTGAPTTTDPSGEVKNSNENNQNQGTNANTNTNTEAQTKEPAVYSNGSGTK